MIRERVDVLVLGAGAAGLAAATKAADCGARAVLLDREAAPGGVLEQCIHPGFGLHRYKEELTGPEFAQRLVAEFEHSQARFHGNRYASTIDARCHEVDTLGPSGRIIFEPEAVILTTGARERPFGALGIPSHRPSGIFTAGVAQRLVNIDGVLPGERAVILGSGDIGLIMARRLQLEGVEVVAVLEQRPFPGGLLRNVVQCLEDFEIPLLLNHTICAVHGAKRLEGLTVVQVDDQGAPVAGTEELVKADTLILSVGLIPDNEIVIGIAAVDPANGGLRVDSHMRTEAPWLFAAGNNVVIFDLADWVADAGQVAGRYAADYALGRPGHGNGVPIVRGTHVLHLIPSALIPGDETRLLVRVDQPIPRGRLHIGDELDRGLVGARPSEMIEVSLSKDEVRLLCDQQQIRVEVVAE